MTRNAITIRIREDLIDRLDDEAEESGVSRSAYIRQILENRHRASELEKKVDSLEEQVDSREDRIATLEEQLARRSQMESKVEELSLELRRDREPDAPFFIKWYRWYQANKN